MVHTSEKDCIVRIFRKLVLAALVSVTTAAQAGAIESLQKFNADTDGLSGSFSQSVQSRNRTQQADGTFDILRPGRFRWEYSRPYRQTIVGDGRHVWLYDKDLEQVSKSAQNQAIGDSPAAILSDKNALSSNFDLKEDGSSGGVEYVLATPKSRNSPYQSVRIGFKDGVLAEMQLKDSFGNQTHIRFGNLRQRPNFAAGHFRFTPPQGVDVLEQ